MSEGLEPVPVAAATTETLTSTVDVEEVPAVVEAPPPIDYAPLVALLAAHGCDVAAAQARVGVLSVPFSGGLGEARRNDAINASGAPDAVHRMLHGLWQSWGA